MNKTFKALCAVAVSASVAFGGEAKSEKDLKKVIEDQGIYVETSQKGIVLSGYVDAGYTYGFGDGNNTLNQRTAQDAGTAANQKGDFNINAFKLALEKGLGDKNELAAGFRADLFVGEDASMFRLNTNASDGASDLYLHQAYVALRAPIGNGIDFKVGRFASPVGYEVAERPANLNYSYGLLWNNLQPLNHTGIMASYKINDMVEVDGAIANGTWNNADGTGLGGGTIGSDTINLIGSVNVKSAGGNANIRNTIVGSTHRGDVASTSANQLPAANVKANDGSLVMWDMWGNWAPKFANDKLLLGINTDLGIAQDYAHNNTGAGSREFDETFWGAAVYAKYQFSKLFSLAGRAEYIHNNQSMKFGNGTALQGNDLWSTTLTAGFNVWENVLLRAEYRADFGTDTSTTADSVQHLIAANVVYSF